ncbi:MAG TPA: tetratricopeptide repeat protein [Clostridia bacterium]|nr:tetratricopeptide repeat protein [Clostridia bacterium]
MTVVNGFIITSMVILLLYSFYRMFKKRSLLMLIPVCTQIFPIPLAVLSFVNDVEAPPYVEAVYISFGILLPAFFILYDYKTMTGRIKTTGAFEGLVERAPASDSTPRSLPSEGINPLADDIQVSEIIKDLKKLPEDLQKNFRKCISRANALKDDKDPESAYLIYDTLSKASNSSSMLYYNLAGICYCLKKYDEALDAYKKALELSGPDDPERGEIHYNMGNTNFMLGKYENAVKSYEKAVDAGYDCGKTTENLAFAYIRAGDAEKGIETLKKLTSAQNDYRAAFILGKLLFEAGKLDEAENALRDAVKYQNDSIEARDELGKVLVRQKKTEDALLVFDEIIRINPDHFQAWSSRANTCGKLKRWKEAVAAYKEAIRIKPDSYSCFYNLAMALEESGSHDAAIEAYKSAIRINSDFTDAYNNLGIALSALGKRDEALEVYSEAIRRKPGEFSLYFNMGMCYYEEGRYTQAAAAYRNALDIKPDELEIYYFLGAALTELRNFNDAIEAYKSALEIKPSDGELYYHLAAIYAMLGRYEIAEENLKQAVGLNDNVREDIVENHAFDGMRGKSEFKKLVGSN